MAELAAQFTLPLHSFQLELALSVERTASFAYVRLHGSTELYASRYAPVELVWWAKRIAGWAQAGSDVFVYFDNDARGHAPHDAERLRALVGAGPGVLSRRRGLDRPSSRGAPSVRS